jgi:hypothetical protein
VFVSSSSKEDVFDRYALFLSAIMNKPTLFRPVKKH